MAEGSFEKECGTARCGDSGFGTSDKAVQRGGEAVHAFPYAVSGPSGHGRPRSADGHEPSEWRVQRIAPDADFRRKMPCEARQAGRLFKPGDEKAHGRVAKPILDGQQPLAHEGGGIVPVPGEALRADAQDDSRRRGQPTAHGLVVEKLIPHWKGRSLVGRVAFTTVTAMFAGQGRCGKINGDPMGVRRAP